VGGLLVEVDWRWVFIVNVPIGIAALAVGWRVLENTRDEHATARPDVIGAGLFTVAIAALILAIVQGSSWGWGGGRVVGLFVASFVLIAIVAVRSSRHPAPLVEPVIVRTRAILLANLSAILFFMAFATLLIGGVLFQTEVWRLSVLTAGLQLALGPLMSAIFAVPAAILGRKYGQRYIGALGTVMFAIAGGYFSATMTLEPDFLGAWLPTMLIGGAGIGLVLPTLSAAATAPLPPSRFATGTAVFGMTRQVGSALGVALFVAILGEPTRATVLADFEDVWTFMIISVLAAGVMLISIGPVRIGVAGTEGSPAVRGTP
jgi:MFS family permease